MIKNAIVYLFGGVINRAIPFLLLPVLTRYLAPEEYGTLAIFQVLLSFTIPFVGMNMHNNISRNFAKMARGEMARLLGTLVGLLCVTTSIIGLFIAIWVVLRGPALGIPGVWLLALPPIAALSMAHQFNLTVLRNQERPLMFGGFEVGNTLFNLSVSLALVVVLRFGWHGRAIGIASAAVCFGIIGLAALRRQKLLAFEYDRSVLVEVLRISLPLIPHTLGAVVIAMSDRLFIDYMVNRNAVGLYTVGYTFGMIVNLFVEAFNRAWSPWFYRQMTDITEQGRRRIVRYTYACFAALLVLALAVTCMSYLVLPFMVSAEYQAASQFILLIAVGYAFRGMYTMIFPYLVYCGKTSFLGFATTCAAVANLGLNYIFIHMNGPIGAAQATLFVWLMLFLCTWAYSVRICQMPWFNFVRRSI